MELLLLCYHNCFYYIIYVIAKLRIWPMYSPFHVFVMVNPFFAFLSLAVATPSCIVLIYTCAADTHHRGLPTDLCKPAFMCRCNLILFGMQCRGILYVLNFVIHHLSSLALSEPTGLVELASIDESLGLLSFPWVSSLPS